MSTTYMRLVLGTMICFVVTSFAAGGNSTGHDLFIASDKSIGLTLNVATDNNNIFFSFVGPATSSWISFGLGSDRMESAMMFVIYASSSGKNITISPRLPTKHAEPEYSSSIQVQALGGSGINNGTITANFKCGNYNLNLSSTSQKMCFASGPFVNLQSDDPNAALMRHRSYGSFTMDMVQATGAGGVAVAPVNIFALNVTGDVGSAQTSFKVDHDASVQAHASIIIFTFLFLMPFGVSILRIWGLVEWHGINQGLAVVLALVGTALGISIGTQYNRSKNFSSAHQLIGIVIFIAVVAQFAFGYIHHRTYTRTQMSSKLAPVHIWLGRFIILASIVGFPLALSSSSDAWFAGLVVVFCFLVGLVIFWHLRRTAIKRKAAHLYPQISGPNGLSASVERPRQDPPVNLQTIRASQSAYSNSDRYSSHQTEFHVSSVEPWQRICRLRPEVT
ncbi:iron reductase domain protein [Hyaloscypha variabilis]